MADFRSEQVKRRLAERYRTETDPIVRASLLRAVGEADEERGGELAAEALGGPDAVSQLLGSLDEPEAMFAVLARSGSAFVRMVVADALEDALGEDRDTDERLVRLLGPLLTDPDRSVRMAAVHALAKAGPAPIAVVDSLAAAAEPITHGDAPELDPARNAVTDVSPLRRAFVVFFLAIAFLAAIGTASQRGRCRRTHHSGGGAVPARRDRP